MKSFLQKWSRSYDTHTNGIYRNKLNILLTTLAILTCITLTGTIILYYLGYIGTAAIVTNVIP